MTITEAYSRIAQIEEAMKLESTRLAEREKYLLSQINTAPDYGRAEEKATLLAGVRILKECLPERQKSQRAEIFKLNSEIEQQKNQ